MKRWVFGPAHARAAWLPPAVLFLVLVAAPFVYRAWAQPRAVHITKIALLVAFSGQLAARGNDLDAAAELAAQQNGGERVPTLAAISALDDQGQAQIAQQQARGAAADPAIRAVLCCSSLAAERAVAPILPPRDVFYSLDQAAVLPGEEAQLARQSFGGTTVVVISDRTIPQDNRATSLTTSFKADDYTVTTVAVNFTAGSKLPLITASVARERPDLVVLDMDYPAAAVVGAALRHAAVTAPLLGDDRLDGAPAAALLGGLGAVWYVAPDRNALLQRAPATFGGDFARLRGHQPSSRDILAYLQTRAAIQEARDQVQPGLLPTLLYQLTSGVYPGQAVSTIPGAAP